MSDLIIRPDSPISLPAHLQGFTTGNTDALMAAVGGGRNRIGLKGNRFRCVINGKEEGVWEENYLDVIILGAVPSVSRIFYAGAYKAGEKEKPHCYSVDGVSPADDVQDKQSAKCELCPKNVVGSRITDNGVKAKACSYFRRLVVMLAGDPEGIIYQLDVKSMGLFGESHPKVNRYNLNDYAKFVQARGLDVGVLVTRLSFDTDQSVPKLLFKAERYITQEELGVVQRLVNSTEVQDYLEVSMRTVDLSAEVSAGEVPDPEPAPAPAPAAAAPAPRPAPAAAAPAPRPAPAAAAPAPRPAPRPAAAQAPAAAAVAVEDNVPIPAETQVVEVDSADELASLLAELE